MKPKDIIKGLQEQGVRSVWEEEEEKWYFAAIDVIRLLTESAQPQIYWRSLKKRLQKEGYTPQKGYSLRSMVGPDGRRKRTVAVDLEQFFRMIQSVRTPRAEVWRTWLAQAGEEQVKESYDPERGIDRALDNWRRMGRDEKWILQRMMSQETRNKLTQYWGSHQIRDSEEFRSLTNAIHEGWSRMTVQEHKELKGLRSQNLRDHMTEAELIFMALAEMAVRQIAESRNAIGLQANLEAAGKGAGIAGGAREKLEEHTRRKVISGENFREIRERGEKKSRKGKKKVV